MALDAASFMASLISLARQSSAPRKIPGNASRLLIWLGKSLLPVPTTAAPACLASSGMISGVGFAMAKTMASFPMVFIISCVKQPGADTPMKTSALFKASASVPRILPRLVIRLISACVGFNSDIPSQMTPKRSHRISRFTPMFIKWRAMEMPAAPAPLMTQDTDAISFPTTFTALSNAAPTTMAVPC